MSGMGRNSSVCCRGRTGWGRGGVDWWTHKIRGLHRNDFIMAAKTDAMYAAASENADQSA